MMKDSLGAARPSANQESANERIHAAVPGPSRCWHHPPAQLTGKSVSLTLVGQVMSRRFATWQKMVALAPLLLVAVCLPGRLMARCHVDGLLHPAPCCSHEEEPGDAGPAFEARDCCDREITLSQRPVFEAVRASDSERIAIAALAPWTSSTAVVASPAIQVSRALLRYGPARQGPPIVLAKHAFLI
jgi:hypothetical protein